MIAATEVRSKGQGNAQRRTTKAMEKSAIRAGDHFCVAGLFHMAAVGLGAATVELDPGPIMFARSR